VADSFFNPNAPKTQMFGISGTSQRKLEASMVTEFAKSPHFLNLALNTFPVSTVVSSTTFDPGASCRSWLHDGALDDLCGPIVLNWASQTADFASSNLALVQSQVPAPADKDFQLQRHTEIARVAAMLVQAIAKLKDHPESKDGTFSVIAVLLNEGDGDDVLYPDGTLSCDACGSEPIKMISSSRYQTIKAHSFLQTRYELDAEHLTLDQLDRLKKLVKTSAVLKINFCSHIAIVSHG
jgi:hypothetical protein